ncbi:hypothetical protein [Streptomyces albidoflavus]|uniref:hypothetical protein n=1 Tax=Streptomyces albidoflavus TaxID=1886 RepID=UPI0033D54B1A
MTGSADPARQAAHAARTARLKAAESERARLVALLVDGGLWEDAAAEAVDRLIVAVRDADAVRLLHASMNHDRVKYAVEGADWLSVHRHEAPVAVSARTPRRGLRFWTTPTPGQLRPPMLCRVTRTVSGDPGLVHWREGIDADGTGGTPRRATADTFHHHVGHWAQTPAPAPSTEERP